MLSCFEYLTASFVCEWQLISLKNLLQLSILGICENIFLYLPDLGLPKMLLHTVGRFNLSPVEGMAQCVSRRHAAVFPARQGTLLCKPQVC